MTDPRSSSTKRDNRKKTVVQKPSKRSPAKENEQTTSLPEANNASTNCSFPVIGIGASAGGLESLESLFSTVPGNTHAAFVVVQHLSPDFKSMMDEILRRKTDLSVCLIEDGMRLAPATVFLIPPNFDLELDGDVFKLCDRTLSHGVNHPIDRFFVSLAVNCGKSCAAVVCSGSGSDGSRGIRDVCERGGMVLVEDPAVANFDGMPRSAVESGVVDFVAPVSELSVWLTRFIEAYNQSPGTAFEPPIDAQPGSISALEAVTSLLRTEYGIDFLQYKPNMVIRRIERRLQLMDLRSIDQYVQQLQTDPNELNRLYQDLLIGVTRFFRDPAAFDALSQDVLPDLIKNSVGRTLRVWTPGCATGEETYSLAIRISEAFAKMGRQIDVKIFATDAHRSSLDKASAGYYTSDQLGDVPKSLIEKYFTRVGTGFQVKRPLRRMVVFAPHNLLQDASFTNVDLVVCRNTLIYFKQDGQRRALALMHFGLTTGGFLFLGPSEAPNQTMADYQTVNRRWRIYRKVSDSSCGLPDLRMSSREDPSSHRIRSTAKQQDDNLIRSAMETMAGNYVPPSFVTDSEFRLVYSTAGAADYLKPQQGKFDAALPDLLSPELKTTVLIGLQRAARLQLNEPVLVGTVSFANSTHQPDRHNDQELRQIDGQSPVAESDSTNDQVESINGREKTTLNNVQIIIRKIELNDSTSHGFIVTLERSNCRPAESSMLTTSIDADVKSTLELKLRHTQENLQASVEQLETSNEQLQATNEEMVASNEELQSTNEELHSVNEELYTVNSEHQKKIEELTELTEDMENLFRASDMATIFLDEELRIRRLTPKASEILNLNVADIGRKLQNFRNPLKNFDLHGEIATTLASESISENEVRSQQGGRYLLRLLPYTSAHGSVGVVLTLIDLFRLESARQSMETREARFRGTFENAAVGIAHIEFDGSWLRVNERLCEIVGYDREELLASDFQSITHADDLDRDLIQLEHLKAGKIDSYSLRKRFIHKAGYEVPIDLTVSVTDEPYRDAPYCIAVLQDASEQLAIEQQLADGVRHRDQFLAVLSHELRNPLASLKNAVQLLQTKPDNQHDVEEYVSVLDRQTDHMTRLVEDLLDTSRIAQNKIKLQQNLIDFRPIVEEAVESMRSGFKVKRQSLELNVEGSDFTVFGDKTRLLQVIENLLSNARRYTHVGGFIKVTLLQQNEKVTLDVTDNGSGIAPAKLESIFSMFTRGEETQETQGGLGIGLALARMLMQQHRGSISVDSEGEGKGARFSISLPLAQGSDANVKSPAATDQKGETTNNSYRIVLVDDDDDARITMEALLQLKGHTVVTAADGLEGLATIADNAPDLALVDLSMPGLNGIELAQELSKQGRACKLIALTGHGQKHDRVRTAEAGFLEHLVKPIDISELNRLIHQVMEAT